MADALSVDLDALARRVADGNVVVLTGAGCSTESGIPDYRGPGTRARARNPIQYRQFVDQASFRARYWSRSAVGYRRIVGARPNPAHLALCELEQRGLLRGLITQNVDGLHQAAGSRQVLELHGALSRVRCLGCDQRTPRELMQQRLLRLNPDFQGLHAEAAPDGDAELEQDLSSFRVPACESCGGTLKPDVVFFGESVPKASVDQAYGWLHEASLLLIVGSSLAVFSGYRFLKRAHERNIFSAVINLGECRGQDLVQLRVEAPAGQALPQLLLRLQRQPHAPPDQAIAEP